MNNTIQQRLMQAAAHPFMKRAVGFFDGMVYPALYACLAFVTSLFGLEIYFFILTTLIIVFTSVFSRDTKPLLTPAVMVVYCISWQHTFQPPYNSSFLSSAPSLITIGVCAVFVVASFVFRLAVYKPVNVSFFRSRTFLGGGLLLFAAALILNGLFYFNGKSLQNLLLGLLISFSFVFLFIYFFNTYRADKDSGKFFAYLFALITAVILLQIAKVYLFDDVLLPDGSINKDAIITGWGSPNKVGIMLAMYLPAGFYLAYKCRHGWLWYLFAIVQMGGICLTLCRSAMLIGACMVVAAAIVLSVVKSLYRKVIRIFNLVIVAAGLAVFILFFDRIREMFALLFERGFSDSGRFFIWKNGLKNFLREPFFGVGFYAPIVAEDPSWTYGFENWFMPDMYHNMFIQVFACCGIVGMLALVYHFAQVLNTLTRRVTAERLFYFGTFLMIVGTAMFENHIFHIVPALLYSLNLLLWERDVEAETPLSYAKNRRGLFVFGK